MRLLFVYNLMFCVQLFAQNYMIGKGKCIYIVQMKQDSVWVREYRSSRFYNVLERKECLLKANEPQRANLYTSSLYQVEDKADKLILSYRKDLKSNYKCLHIDKKMYYYNEREMFLFEKSSLLYMLKDSLSGPDSTLSCNLNGAFFLNFSDSIPLLHFMKEVNYISDSLTSSITSLKKPYMDTLHHKIDSLKLIADAEVEHLLQTTNYGLFYGKKLLYKLSLERPQLLIDYVAKNPSNQKDLLKGIRWHPQAEEICARVKAVKVSSKAKRQITRQYRIQKWSEIGLAAGYITMIGAEITAIVALVVVLT